MKKIKINDFSAETRYVWECKNCNTYNEMVEDPNDEVECTCDECFETFEIE